MSSIIIRCPICSKKNRVSTDKIGLTIKCGSCGAIILEKGTKLCKLCNEIVYYGINLSNGEMVHKSCLESIQIQEKSIRNDIDIKIKKLHELEKELKNRVKKRQSIGFKIISIFIKQDIDIEQIQKSIKIIEKDIQKLQTNLNILKKKLEPIYDYLLTYPPDWRYRKDAVIARDGEYCHKCGKKFIRTAQLHLHHIVPLSKGGNNKISNLQLLCEKCHLSEHGRKKFNNEFNSKETAFSKRVENIEYAIKNGKRIKFGYKKPSDDKFIQRIVHPAALVKVKHNMDDGFTLCVKGYCELRKAERTFAIKRMKNLKII